MKPEITQEIGLVAAGRFQAASSHEEEDHGAMNSIAKSKVDGGLVLRGMESPLRIEFDVCFELWSEIVADDKAGNPSIRSLVHKLIADFIIHIDRAKFPGELEGQKESFARGGDPTADSVVRVVKEELGENRGVEAGLSGIVETPFDAGIGLT